MVSTRVFAALACLSLSSSAHAQETRDLVKLEVRNKPLISVLDDLSEKHGLNYVVSEEACRLAGAVHCRLDAVPLERAAQARGGDLGARHPAVVAVAGLRVERDVDDGGRRERGRGERQEREKRHRRRLSGLAPATTKNGQAQVRGSDGRKR